VKLFAAVVAAVLVAAVPVSASTQFASTFVGAYSVHVPDRSSGLEALATWSDPGEPGGKPKEVSRIRVDFEPGARLDTAALPYCRASDVDVQIRSVHACPRRTIVGSVRGQGLYPGSAPFNTYATLFNARRQIIVVVTLDSPHGRLLTNFRDDVRRSSITVNLKVPGNISLIRFHAVVPAHTRKVRGKRRAYFTTPPACPASGSWTTTFTFSYEDGSTDQHSSPTPCNGA
jgi:hypothetical protein